ncbi:ABC transporter permease, partial [Actinomadura roseirufa]|uniref:ABC transporter permease n=1 Tax=Actinomadura roseirufa TaxID=2094049 RepID=UPI0013F16909
MAARKGRLVLSCAAILLSVAFVTGALVFSESVSSAYRVEEPDVTVTAAQDGGTIPETLLAAVRAVPGVASADPDVTVDDAAVTDARGKVVDRAADGGSALASIGTKTTIPTLAGAWNPTPRATARLAAGRAPRGPREAVLDRVSADRARVRVGDVIRIVAVPGAFRATVTGLADFSGTDPGNTRVWLDLPSAQRLLLGRPGALTSITVGGGTRLPRRDLARRVSAAVGGAARAR